MKNKKSDTAHSKIIVLIFSICFLMLFFILLGLSILIAIYSNDNFILKNNQKSIISFLNWLSKFEGINDPFSIFIEILTSIGGVFFGIRIGQWIDNKEDKEKIAQLWGKICFYLKRLKEGVHNKNISIYELAEYRIYWDSLQRADNIATRFLQEDEHYAEISFAFSFLSYYNHSWSNYDYIDEWKDNASSLEFGRVQKWISSFDDLILYTEEMANSLR